MSVVSVRARANLMILLTAAIWGLGFVAQRMGADHMGPFSFNAVRFLLGALSVAPIIWWFDRRSALGAAALRTTTRAALLPGIAVGLLLFAASAFQQTGIADTSAGKAAFISGLYIVIVPLLGLPMGHAVRWNGWVAVLLAATGLYLLSVTEDFTVALGDVILLAGAFFWALHILAIDVYASRIDPLRLSLVQFVSCAAASFVVALLVEEQPFSGLSPAAGAVIYSGIVAVGVAYTFQVLGQRHVRPAAAALLFSLESVFGVLGGALLLGENLGLRGYLGCGLMLAGILVSQGFSRADAVRTAESAVPGGGDLRPDFE